MLLLLQLALFIYGFPPFHFGIWVQVEPIMLAAYVFAYMDCAWLAFGLAKRWLVLRAATPLFWVMLLWVAWQFFATILAGTPWRSWFGPPEIAEGTSWHVCLLLMVLVGYPLMRIPYYRRAVLLSGLGMLTLMAALHRIVPNNEVADNIGTNSERWVSARFPKDLPFISGYLWIAALCWREITSKRMIALAMLFCAVILVVSLNRTAMVFQGGALLLTAVPIFMAKPRFVRRIFYPSRAWRITMLAGCLAPLAWVAFSINIAFFQPMIDRMDTLTNRTNEHIFSLSNKDGTIGGRIPFMQVSWAAMQHEPWRWLLGDGWGRFTDDTYKYALVDGVYVYKDGKRAANWEALQDVPVAHSHSQPVEALLSLGLPGMILWFAIPMLGIWYLPQRLLWPVAPMIVALVALSYFWFEQMQDTPFRALALIGLCHVSVRHMRLPYLRLQWKPDTVALTLLCGCLLMGWTAWEQRNAIEYTQRLRVALLMNEGATYPLEWLTDDTRRGGDRLRETAVMYELLLAQNIHTQPADDEERGWYALFLQAAHNYAISENSNARAASTEMYLVYKLFGDLSVPSLQSLKMAVFPHVPEIVLLVAGKAPLRDDLAASFLANLPVFIGKDIDKQKEYLRRLLAIAPDHRGALWVLGNMLKETPATQAEGDAMIRRAIALGIQRVFPVTDAQLAAYKADARP